MAAASHKVYFITFMSHTFAPIYDVQQKQNPGPSGNNDLDARELFPAQVDDKDKDDNEEPHHVDVVDNQVGFYLSYQKVTILTLITCRYQGHPINLMDLILQSRLLYIIFFSQF